MWRFSWKKLLLSFWNTALLFSSLLISAFALLLLCPFVFMLPSAVFFFFVFFLCFFFFFFFGFFFFFFFWLFFFFLRYLLRFTLENVGFACAAGCRYACGAAGFFPGWRGFCLFYFVLFYFLVIDVSMRVVVMGTFFFFFFSGFWNAGHGDGFRFGDFDFWELNLQLRSFRAGRFAAWCVCLILTILTWIVRHGCVCRSLCLLLVSGNRVFFGFIHRSCFILFREERRWVVCIYVLYLLPSLLFAFSFPFSFLLVLDRTVFSPSIYLFLHFALSSAIISRLSSIALLAFVLRDWIYDYASLFHRYIELPCSCFGRSCLGCFDYADAE